jgi:hypothetical protein
VREAEFFFEEGAQLDGMGELGDDAGHAAVGGEGAFGLAQCGEVFDQVAEFFSGERLFQTVGHQGESVAALLFDVFGGDAGVFAFGGYEVDEFVGGLFDDAGDFVAVFGFDGGGAVTDGDGRGGFENSLDEFPARKFVADGEKIRASFAGAAVGGVTFDAGGASFVVEDGFAACGVAFAAHGDVAIDVQWIGLSIKRESGEQDGSGEGESHVA